MAAAELGQGYEMLAKDPALANMFGPDQRYQLLSDIAKLKSFTRWPAYLNPKAPPVQQQPDPIKMQEAQAKQTTAQASVMSAQSAQAKEQRLVVEGQMKHDLKSHDLTMKVLDHDRTNNRQDAETAHRIIHDEQELTVQKAQIALQHHNATEDRRAAIQVKNNTSKGH
jgi:hypothetical protein